MNISRLSLSNPAALVIILVLIAVFGTISLVSLPIQLMPNIQQPQININTGWRAAAPQELESVIVEPIENAVKNIPGVQDITTFVNPGGGNINLTFAIGTDMQQAMLDVLSRLNQAPPLPLDARDPVVTSGGGGQGPMAASILLRPAPGNPVSDLSQYQKLIDDVVEPRLSRIPGIASVNLNSHRPQEVRIVFDPYKLAAAGLPVSALAQTIASASDVSAGFANVGRRNYTVRFAGQYRLDELNEMIVGYSSSTPIYLKDVATVTETLVDPIAFSLRNGLPGYYITISRTNESNTVAVLDALNAAITELNEGPLKAENLVIELSFDASVHIRNAIDLVKSNLGLGVILATLVLWFFLRGIRATLIIATTIPVSLFSAFLALQVFDRSLNVISLAGLAFAVGIVLDAAIIVQENILRHRQLGRKGMDAILKGTTEVTGALFASTITSVAIFLPIVFMEGIEGQLFADLALTLSVAVLASMLGALTLLPVINQYWSKQIVTSDRLAPLWQRLSDGLIALSNTPLKRGLTISLTLGCSGLAIWGLLPKTDFLPRVPTDGFFYAINQPPGTNLEYVRNELAPIIKARLAPYMNGEAEPPIKNYNFYSFNGTNTGGFIYSADPKRTDELMTLARTKIFAGLPDTQVFMNRGSMLNFNGVNRSEGVTLHLQGSDMEALMNSARVGIEAINKALPGSFPRPNPGLSLSEPEIQLVPDDRRISQSGLSRMEVANTVRAMTDGLFVAEYFNGDERMNVVLRGDAWRNPDELATLPIFTPNAGVQALGELAQVTRTVGPSQLLRVDGKRTVSIALATPTNTTVQEVIDILKREVEPKIIASLPEDARITYGGNANDLANTLSSMAKNFVLAIFILFLVMAAIFKSAKDSLLALLVMPMAIGGGVLGLYTLNLFTFQSLDLLTMIGFIILLGLVVNNAILLVAQTRLAEREGYSREDAVHQAILIRARPVYMSTLTSVFGMLPLMLMPGVGAEIYRGLAAVIVGGMLVSALLTLVLLPSLLCLGSQKRATSVAPIHDLKSAKLAS